MAKLEGRTAVVTGAASGIGLALAERCASEGMNLVMADVEDKPLREAEARFKEGGARVLAVLTDVSKASEVEALADAAFGTFGAVHLLFSNAGVGTGNLLWESSLADWQWVIGVNLGGLAHGIRAFVPRMIAQGTDCRVVITASMAGLIPGPGMGIYHATKHAIVSVAETLYQELALTRAKVRVSVLCPGFVITRMTEAERNRPARLRNPPRQSSPQQAAAEAQFKNAFAGGMRPGEVADKVFEAIEGDRFYIFTHPEFMGAVEQRMRSMLSGENPQVIAMPS